MISSGSGCGHSGNSGFGSESERPNKMRKILSIQQELKLDCRIFCLKGRSGKRILDTDPNNTAWRKYWMFRQLQDTWYGWDSFASLACGLLHCRRRKWLHQDENLGSRNPGLVCIVRLCYWFKQKLCSLSTVTSYCWFYSLLCFYNKARMISFLVRELLLSAGAGSVPPQVQSFHSFPALRFFTRVRCTLYSI